MKTSYGMLIGVAAATVLAACGGNGGGDDSDTGSVTLGVSDAPVDSAEQVNISFTQVDLQPADGERISLTLDSDPETEGNQPVRVNLLDYTGADRVVLLDGETLPAGDYEWIRLYVEDAKIVFDTTNETANTYDLGIPSNANTGLKLVNGFTVSQDGQSDFTIDFDLRKSVHEMGNSQTANGETANDETNGYLMRPTLRLIDNLDSGQFAGTVTGETTGLSDAEGACAVYVYAGDATSLDDICYDDNGAACTMEGRGENPVTTAPLQMNAETGEYHYETALLDAGAGETAYQLAVTCDAGMDEPATDDSVTFNEPVTETLQPGSEPTVVDLAY